MKLHLHLYLVIEVPKVPGVEARKKDAHRVYIVEPSYVQLYRTTRLHERNHFQIDGYEEVEKAVDQYLADGFQLVDPEKVDRTEGKVVSVLDSSSNHFLNELTVINDFRGLDSRGLISAMRMNEWARYFALGKGRKRNELRGTWTCDVGFCGSSIIDKTLVKGMNAPIFTTKFNSTSGLDDGSSLTQSVLKSASALDALRMHIGDRFLLGWEDDFSTKDGRRRDMFSNRAAKKHGVHSRSPFIFEGMTLGLSGRMPDGSTAVLSPHVDQSNALVEEYSTYYGFGVHVPISYPGEDEPTTVRVALGCYGKKCVDDFMYRFEVNDRLLKEILAWKNGNPDLFHTPSYLLKFDEEHTHRFIRPRVDKKLFFSIFVDGLLKIGEKTNYDLGILFEAVIAAGITTSPIGWYKGSFVALDDRGTGNYFESYARTRRRDSGSVSGGPGKRRQPAHQGHISREKLYSSLRNMLALCQRSDQIDSSEDFVNMWSKSPKEGGVYLAGGLISHEHVYLLTALGIIKHYPHATNSRIAKGTDTYARLTENEGVREEGIHVVEIVRFTALALGVQPYVAENLFCEMFRERSDSSFEAKDTIVKGQGIYTIHDGLLLKTESDGSTQYVNRPTWKFDQVKYGTGHRWWRDDFKLSSVSGNVFLTNKSKLLQKVGEVESNVGENEVEEEVTPKRRRRRGT